MYNISFALKKNYEYSVMLQVHITDKNLGISNPHS